MTMALQEFLETGGFMGELPEEEISPVDLVFDLPPLTTIAATVAKVAGVRLEDLFGPRRARQYAAPRQVAMWLAEEARPDMSLPQLGRFFKRDHTTILHARRRRNELIIRDPWMSLYLKSREILGSEGFQSAQN